MYNKTQTVRFYVRANGRGEDVLIPLRMKVWNGAAKKWLYVTTDLRVTPRQFRRELATDGTPTAEASNAFAKDVERYRAAAVMVLSAAVVNNRVHTVSSEYLNSRVNGIVGRMRMNAKTGANQPIVVGASPMDDEAQKVCAGCAYRGETCRAPWLVSQMKDTAAEFAIYNGICPMRKEVKDERQD